MKAIKAKGLVQPDHKVLLQLPGDVTPGEHVFILVLEDVSDPLPERRAGFDFPVDSYGPWPEDLSLSRTDLYDDSGR